MISIFADLATTKTITRNFEAEDNADCECEDASVSDKRGDVKRKKSKTHLIGLECVNVIC